MTKRATDAGVSKRRNSSRATIDEFAGPAVTIYATPGRMEVLPLSSMNLILATGKIENGPIVLVPYVEFRLLKDVDGEDSPQETYNATIAFENAAFIIMDMARDLAEASHQLVQVAQGELAVEPVRMNYALECLNRAAKRVDESIGHLRRLPATPQEVAPKRISRHKATQLEPKD